jgi:hypothetical protein
MKSKAPGNDNDFVLGIGSDEEDRYEDLAKYRSGEWRDQITGRQASNQRKICICVPYSAHGCREQLDTIRGLILKRKRMTEQATSVSLGSTKVCKLKLTCQLEDNRPVHKVMPATTRGIRGETTPNNNCRPAGGCHDPCEPMSCNC